MTLLYFGNVPKIILMTVGLVSAVFFNLSLTGVSKNFLALARERGPGKYPVFNRDYLWSGLPMFLSYLLLAVVPFLMMVVSIFVIIGEYVASWPYILSGISVIYILWQWRFGLTSAIILDRKIGIIKALQQSYVLTNQKLWSALGLVLLNQLILILSPLIPVIGTFLAVNWITLSGFYFYWQVR